MAKDVMLTGKFTYNSVVYGVTNMETNKVAEDIDVTDTSTSGNEREYKAGRQRREVTVEMYKNVNAADPPLGTANAAELDFEGNTYAGSMIITEMTITGQIDNAIQMTIKGRFTGTVTETPAT